MKLKESKFTPHNPVEKICKAAAAQISLEIIENGYPFAVSAESPIEEVFGTAINAYYKYISGADDELEIWPAELFNDACSRLEQEEADSTKQYKVLGTSQFWADEHTRVDFLFAHKNWRTGRTFRLVVECDGHEFHERTKEQAARDRSRDRMFQEKGCGIFRFTGSEIWKDPVGCAVQVAEWISHKSCEKP